MKIRIPNELSDIKLEQVQRAMLLDQNDQIDEFAKKVHSVAVMTNRTAQEVATVNLQDLDDLYDSIFGMINGNVSAPLTRYVSYLGREYAFIEDVRDMETGAFVDIDQMTKKDQYAANLHKIMAILYRPIDAKIGDRYRLKSYVKEDPKEREERQVIFLKHMGFDVVRGAAGFFLLVIQRCLNISGNSFPQLRDLTVEEVIRGAGITLSTEQPEGA